MKPDLNSATSAPSKQKPHSFFRCIAEMTSRRMGSPFTFLLALFLILLWAVSGFFIGFDERWQLIINTGTTIATFLMVILIQNTQYRESRSMQLKLNEMLYGTKNTRNFFLEIEEESDEELDHLKQEFIELRKKYLEQLRKKNERVLRVKQVKNSKIRG